MAVSTHLVLFLLLLLLLFLSLSLDVVDNDQNDVNDIDDDGTRWGATTSGETHASVFICYYCYHFFDVVADGDDKILII